MELESRDMILMTQDTLTFELLYLSFEQSHLTGFAKDCLNAAMNGFKRGRPFWDLLFQETILLEEQYAIDQYDLVVTCLLLVEQWNHQGFILPKVCFDLSAARLSQFPKTTHLEDFLRVSHFEPMDLEPMEPAVQHDQIDDLA